MIKFTIELDETPWIERAVVMVERILVDLFERKPEIPVSTWLKERAKKGKKK